MTREKRIQNDLFSGATTHSSSLAVTEEEEEDNTEGNRKIQMVISGKAKERRARFNGSNKNKNESVV